MSGLFGVISRKDCSENLFYGTDYHSHLGAQRAGLAVFNSRIKRSIHNIGTSQFKSKFVDELPQLKGNSGIGVISDLEPQPIIISASFGTFALVFNGLLANKRQLAKELMSRGRSFSEMSSGQINSVEVIGKLIASRNNILEGIKYFFEKISGSASLLILAKEGVYAIRDGLGRTPLVVAKKGETLAVASENSAFASLGLVSVKELLPGETVLLTRKGWQKKIPGQKKEKICAFLWIYSGFPASSYNGKSVELVRERCGENLARADNIRADLVTGVPDSGIAHALGYARASGFPYRRPLVKYTAGYGRSYTPPLQETRDQVAKMKLIPIREVIKGKRIIVCDDSIVRGTQLKNQGVKKLWQSGAKEVHVRIACPPLMFPCRYCLSTRTRKELATRRILAKLVGRRVTDQEAGGYVDDKGSDYGEMVSLLGQELGVTSLKYQTVDEMILAIGLPQKRLCLECWLGRRDNE
ncbi:MAG: amidophosphoribosyltransferase [Candidatus Shapirobacteria bacterium]|nr:amidophosphoribosyltransferase [Candidatus Shapirobacteria bacterium]MDD5073976.1 amidophosphoribosyltransferase [Candidatus Shapirobacteria bacterium]MDD5481599.1 amidophosphoribosyltransferase [Candidatus Shapirobacteria bacterium]